MQPFHGNLWPSFSQPLRKSRQFPPKRQYWSTSLHRITLYHHENLMSHIGLFFFAHYRDKIKRAAQTIYINIPVTCMSNVLSAKQIPHNHHHHHDQKKGVRHVACSLTLCSRATTKVAFSVTRFSARSRLSSFSHTSSSKCVCQQV